MFERTKTILIDFLLDHVVPIIGIGLFVAMLLVWADYAGRVL